MNGGNGLVYRSVPLGGAVIPVDGLLVVATASASGAVLAARDLLGNVDWQNGPDAVLLVSPAGAVIDALQYGVATALSVGEGTPADDVGAGISLSRDLLATDTDDNAADFFAATPTPGAGFQLPGQATPAPVPEAPTLLMLSGAIGLLCAYRTGNRGQPAAVPECVAVPVPVPDVAHAPALNSTTPAPRRAQGGRPEGAASTSAPAASRDAWLRNA